VAKAEDRSCGCRQVRRPLAIEERQDDDAVGGDDGLTAVSACSRASWQREPTAVETGRCLETGYALTAKTPDVVPTKTRPFHSVGLAK
jgi:hypothetical protein